MGLRLYGVKGSLAPKQKITNDGNHQSQARYRYRYKENRNKNRGRLVESVLKQSREYSIHDQLPLLADRGIAVLANLRINPPFGGLIFFALSLLIGSEGKAHPH